MKWNWQKDGWPTFTYERERLAECEAEFLRQSGVYLGAIKHLAEEEQTGLTIELISNEAVTTSEIEGELLNRDSVQSSIRRHLGLQADRRKVSAAEEGIAAMMTDLYRTYDRPLSESHLYAWHEMLTQGRTDLKRIGAYRTHAEPMQVVSGPVGRRRVHFEAPPSSSMRQEMRRYIGWFNESAPKGRQSLSTLIRAGIAHLYFVSIHPFEDGNGRIARALSEQVLSQGLGRPTLIALSHVINQQRKTYYQALERNNKNLEITDWLIYFARTVLEAQRYTQRLIDFLIDKTKLYDRLRGKLNARQEKVLARMFREGLEGFRGGFSAENYLAITKTSRATATRDLHDLVELGVLRRSGERKHARYALTILPVAK